MGRQQIHKTTRLSTMLAYFYYFCYEILAAAMNNQPGPKEEKRQSSLVCYVMVVAEASKSF